LGLLGALLRFGLGTVALGYTLGLIGYFTALAFGYGTIGWLALVREFSLYLFLPLPFLLLFGLVLGARTTLLVSLLPLGLFLAVYGPQFLPQPGVAAAGPEFRVLSFNAGGNVGGGRPERLLSALRATDAAIVALQEVPPDTLGVIGAALAAEYPYRAGGPDAVVLSEFPVLERAQFRLQDGAYLAQHVVVATPGKPLNLVNVHLVRPAYRTGWRRGLLPWVRGFDPAWRDTQVQELLTRLKAIGGPIVLTGDFNETEWSRPYGMLRTELEDSFREAGWGFGHTYPSNIRWGEWEISVPLARIDYIFHSPELIAVRAYVGPDGGSDHLPVVADLGFR
jgi:endonuclease/exonuclease/phosphatase (EEP) superfamily protein YafD